MKKVIIGMIIGAICAGGGMAVANAIRPYMEKCMEEEIERQAIEYAIEDLESELEQRGVPYETREQVKALVIYKYETNLSDEEYQDALEDIYTDAGFYTYS